MCGSEATKKIQSPDSNWICFVCDPSPLKKDIDFCKEVIETLKSRRKKKRQLERLLKNEKNKVYKSKEFISNSDESEHESINTGFKSIHLCGTGNQFGENESQSVENENQPGKNENQPGKNENQPGENGNESEKNETNPTENEIEESDVRIKEEESSVLINYDQFYTQSKEDVVPVEDGLLSSDSDSDECNLNVPFLFNYTDSIIDESDHPGEGSGIIKKVGKGSGKPKELPVKKRKLSLSSKKKSDIKKTVNAVKLSPGLSDDDYLLESPVNEALTGSPEATQSKKSTGKEASPSTKTDASSTDKTKKSLRHEFKVRKSDYGIESAKRRKVLSSSSESEKEEAVQVSPPSSSVVVVIDSSNDEAGDPAPSGLSKNRSRQYRLSSLSSPESKPSVKVKSEDKGDKKARPKKRIEDISSSDDDKDDSNGFVVQCSPPSSPLSPPLLVKDKDKTVLTIDSDDSSDSLGSKVMRKKKRKLFFSDEDSSTSSSKKKALVLDSSSEEFEGQESGFYFKGKRKKRKTIHARLSSSDSDDDDQVGGVKAKETTPTNKSSSEEGASTSTTPGEVSYLVYY